VLGATIARSDIAIITGFTGRDDSVATARDHSTRLTGTRAAEATLDEQTSRVAAITGLGVAIVARLTQAQSAVTAARRRAVSVIAACSA
jgi:hypothetical protein